MMETILYDIGIEMLQNIQVESNILKEMKCFIKEDGFEGEFEEYSLYDLISDRLHSKRCRKRTKLKDNYQAAFEEIGYAFEKYWDNLSGPFSYKLHQKRKLYYWLDKMKESYGLEVSCYMEDLKVKSDETDPMISIIKILHAREGVTVSDIANELGFRWNRAVQKYLRRLSPELSLEENAEEVFEPYRIGGQPVRVRIQKYRKKSDPMKTYFRTKNTLHPIILQENLMQVGTLLTSLCDSYDKDGSEIVFGIAMDIWYQLSDYAKTKIRMSFTVRNEKLKKFLCDLDNVCPKNKERFYQTEKDMINNNQFEMSIEQTINYLMKVEGRRGSILIKDKHGAKKLLENYALRIVREENGEVGVEAVGPDGDIESLESIIDIWIDEE